MRNTKFELQVCILKMRLKEFTILSNVCTVMLFQIKIASSPTTENDDADTWLWACPPGSFRASGGTEKLFGCHSLGTVQRSLQRQGRWHLEGPVSLHRLQKECVPSSDVPERDDVCRPVS